MPEELEDIVIAPEAGYESEVVEEVPNDDVTVKADNEVEAAVEEVEKAGNNEVAVTEKSMRFFSQN